MIEILTIHGTNPNKKIKILFNQIKVFFCNGIFHTIFYVHWVITNIIILK